MPTIDDVPVFERGTTPTHLPPRNAGRATAKIGGRVYAVTGYDTSRIPLTPPRFAPRPVNDYDRALFGRPPTARQKKTAAEGTQLEREFRQRWLPWFLADAATDFVEVFEYAHRPPVSGTSYADAVSNSPSHDRLTGHERLAHAQQVLRFIKHRLGHLYAPLVDAAIHGRTMEEVGFSYATRRSGPRSEKFRKSAAGLGREKIVDALRFVRDALIDLRTFAAQDEAAIASDMPLAPRTAFAWLATSPGMLSSTWTVLAWTQASRSGRA